MIDDFAAKIGSEKLISALENFLFATTKSFTSKGP